MRGDKKSTRGDKAAVNAPFLGSRITTVYTHLTRLSFEIFSGKKIINNVQKLHLVKKINIKIIFFG